jgi:hypothetical protein
LIEKIICDAELFNLGTTEFNENNKLVRKENEEFGHEKISGHEWRARIIALLESHQHHTEFCQLLLNKTKKANLKNLLKKQEEKNGQKHQANLALSNPGDSEKSKFSAEIFHAKAPRRNVMASDRDDIF